MYLLVIKGDPVIAKQEADTRGINLLNVRNVGHGETYAETDADHSKVSLWMSEGQTLGPLPKGTLLFYNPKSK